LRDEESNERRDGLLFIFDSPSFLDIFPNQHDILTKARSIAPRPMRPFASYLPILASSCFHSPSIFLPFETTLRRQQMAFIDMLENPSPALARTRLRGYLYRKIGRYLAYILDCAALCCMAAIHVFVIHRRNHSVIGARASCSGFSLTWYKRTCQHIIIIIIISHVT
jgi:hypothetical protein